jgi:FkbM family methyltransferase
MNIQRARPDFANHPLYVRQGTSDEDVLRQVFERLQYRPLCRLRDVGLILDCGANVGYSAAFFLSQFQKSHVIAVEPDPENFAMLERNLAPFGDRATAVRSAIWSDVARLRVSRGSYRDGREWATQVVLCGDNEDCDLMGISVGTLLKSSGFDRISILKMDIEGAEAVVFSGSTEWLEKVDAVAIELHNDSCYGNASEAFASAVNAHDFETTKYGELTIAMRRQ